MESQFWVSWTATVWQLQTHNAQESDTAFHVIHTFNSKSPGRRDSWVIGAQCRGQHSNAGDVKGYSLEGKEATGTMHLVLQRSPRTCAQRHQLGRMMHSVHSVKTMNIGRNVWHT